jgi:hypothetical protein
MFCPPKSGALSEERGSHSNSGSGATRLVGRRLKKGPTIAVIVDLVSWSARRKPCIEASEGLEGVKLHLQVSRPPQFSPEREVSGHTSALLSTSFARKSLEAATDQ